MYAYSGVLTALYTRATTGEVHPVEVSLFEALAEWMGQPAYYTRYGGAQPPRLGTQHATIAPYGTFRAADGREVLFSIQNEREWAALCRDFLEKPARADGRPPVRDEFGPCGAPGRAERDRGGALRP